VIVPLGQEAATIMAMAADEILMGPLVAGPIDAQMVGKAKSSRPRLLEGFSKIKQE